MGSKDNFDNFFKNRLLHTEVLKEDWNTPSDIPWEKAKVHFPKKKRRRRYILFILLGLTGVLFGAFFFRQGKMDKTMGLSIIEDSLIQHTVESYDPHHSVSSQEELSSLDSDELVRTWGSNDLSDSGKSWQTSHLGKFKTKQSIKDNQLLNPTKTTSLNLSFDNHPIKNQPEALQSNDQVSGVYKSIDSSKKETANIGTDEKNGGFINNETDLILRRLPQRAWSINSLNVEKIMTEIPLVQGDIETPDIKVPRNWSIGLGTERFLVDPFRESDIKGLLMVESNYRDISLLLSRKIGQKLSMRTGIYYFDADINVDIDFDVSFESVASSRSISEQIAENSNIGLLTINEAESIIGVNFIDGLAPNDGDPLSIRARLPLVFRGVSVPFIWRYSLGGSRLRYYAMAGVSFDIINLSLSDIDLRITDTEGRLINERSSLEPVSEIELLSSFNLGVGVEYILTDRFYVDFLLKADVLDLNFTRVDMGLHYRF